MVGLTEYKDEHYHYFEDSKGRYQGEYKDWWDNGQIWEHCIYLNGEWHGERKYWDEDGVLTYHKFYVRDVLYRDLLLVPIESDEEKFLITLETGAQWLD